ncbi:MAG: protein kinase [Leptolyngbya sp. RL_3_1]|nr:protein kinase [Leptolyngbya sp. RL_3_1]
MSQRRPPRRCVIKQSLRAQVDRDRFFKEADRLIQLGNHAQIPALIAVLASSQELCLVQDYVAGQTLAQTLADSGPWREAQVRSLLLSLLPVLDFIHNHQVIHRDIKPANIILAQSVEAQGLAPDLPIPDQPGLIPSQPGKSGDGGQGTVLPVLVDFGAAKALDKAALEQTGTVIGSAGYAAPEQVLGKAVFASDLYSLGVTCLHLLTQQHPFDLYSALDDRWVWQPYTPYPVSLPFTQILARLTARSLRHRYPTAAAALADLNPGGSLIPARALGRSELPQAWRCRLTLPTPKRVVQSIAVSPNGRAIATGHSDGTVQLWDSQTGQVIYTWGKRLGPLGKGHSDRVTAIGFHPQGHQLFSGGQDGTLKQWDLADYRPLTSRDAIGWPITALQVSEQHLVTAAAGHIYLWQLPDLVPQGDWVRHQGNVTDLALSPDGRRLASTGDDGTLRLWEIPSGQLLHTWLQAKGDHPNASGQEPGLLAVTFHPHSPYLITGNKTGAVTVWSLENLARHYTFSHHQDAVTAVVCWPGGDLLATGSADGQVHLWQLETQRQLALLRHDWAVSALAFDPQRPMLVSGSTDETLRIWQADEYYF